MIAQFANAVTGVGGERSGLERKLLEQPPGRLPLPLRLVGQAAREDESAPVDGDVVLVGEEMR